MAKKLPKPEQITTFELLAINKTAEARQLLKDNGQPDAKDYGDLQARLMDLYRNAKDKVAIEKAFAEIHPHRDFILKHANVGVQNIEPKQKSPGIMNVIAEKTSACEGNTACPCKQGSSNACGPCGGGASGFDGIGGPSPKNNSGNINHTHHQLALVLGVTAIVAIAAIVIHKMKL